MMPCTQHNTAYKTVEQMVKDVYSALEDSPVLKEDIRNMFEKYLHKFGADMVTVTNYLNRVTASKESKFILPEERNEFLKRALDKRNIRLLLGEKIRIVDVISGLTERISNCLKYILRAGKMARLYSNPMNSDIERYW